MAGADLENAFVFIFCNSYGVRPRMALAIAETTSRMRKTKKRILAIPANVPAMPPNPSTAAMIARMTNVMVQVNMIVGCLYLLCSGIRFIDK